MKFKIHFIALLMMVVLPAHSAALKVAVASNFYPTLQVLAREFRQQTGHQLVLSSGSSGQLYAQIKNGAPFDVFMSADMARPEQLVKDGLAQNVKHYAKGQLVLLTNHPDIQCDQIFESSALKFLALANPDLAPYGAAAKAYLQQHKRWSNQTFQRVMGENVAQAMQLLLSGNAQAGLVAKSMLINHEFLPHQCYLPINDSSMPAIDQGMVLLKTSKQSALFDQWVQFLTSPLGQQIMKNQGYVTSEHQS